MDERRINMIADEAARLKKEDPLLGFKEAIEKARLEFGEAKKGGVYE